MVVFWLAQVLLHRYAVSIEEAHNVVTISMRTIYTHYPHIYNPDGSRRVEPCSGYLEIICDDDGVYVRCDECNESYQFDFVMPGSMRGNSKAERRE